MAEFNESHTSLELQKKIPGLVGRVSYLIDSNVWLELLLRQKHADEVRQFLEKVQLDEIYLTEFTLYSIGIITSRLNKEDVFAAFISDLLEGTEIKMEFRETAASLV